MPHLVLSEDEHRRCRLLQTLQQIRQLGFLLDVLHFLYKQMQLALVSNTARRKHSAKSAMFVWQWAGSSTTANVPAAETAPQDAALA